MRLNVGSGPESLPGWVCIDRSPSARLDRVPGAKSLLFRLGLINQEQLRRWPRDIVLLDIRRPLPFPSATVEAIYSSHTLEHLYLNDARAFLREAGRLLSAGGVLRLALPDGEQVARDLLERRAPDEVEPGLHYNRRLLSHPEVAPHGVRRVMALFSGSTHRWQPTRGLIRHLLEEAGFSEITEQSYRVGRMPELETVEKRPDSIFFEASHTE